MNSAWRAEAEDDHERPSKMLLGKRPRPPRAQSMRRTTSMLMGGIVAVEPDDQELVPAHHDQDRKSVMSPSSCSSTTTPHFLHTCGLCKRALPPSGRDIYIYRGDTAFCSSECREKHMREDERCKVKVHPSANTNSVVAASTN